MPAYDRELIARMLDVCGHPKFTLDAYREQARLLREADNADAARVGTGRASQGALYYLDADPDGIRDRAAAAITGALILGSRGDQQPPAGHWLAPFWEMARAETGLCVVDEAMAIRLDGYLQAEFDIAIGKQAAHACLTAALRADGEG